MIVYRDVTHLLNGSHSIVLLGDGILIPDTRQKALHARLRGTARFNIVVATLHLPQSRLDDSQQGIARSRMEILDHESHVMVTHIAHHGGIQVGQLRGVDVTAVGKFLVKSFEARQKTVVGSIPVNGIHIPEYISRTQTLP